MAKSQHINLDEMNVSEMVTDIIQFQQKHFPAKKSETEEQTKSNLPETNTVVGSVATVLKNVVGAVISNNSTEQESSKKNKKAKSSKKSEDKKKDKKKDKVKSDKKSKVKSEDKKKDKKAAKKAKRKEEKAHEKMVDKSIKKLKKQEAYDAASNQNNNEPVTGDFVFRIGKH